MSDLEAVNKRFRACVRNADQHVAAAKVLRKEGHNNMAFNAAVLALEEIGKAVLIGMTRQRAHTKEPAFVREDWLEDHTKKLFWALWTISFGRAADTVQDFQDFSHVASRVHLRRLGAIYVEAGSENPPERIPDDEVDGMVGLAELRVEKERDTFFQDVDEKDRADLDWFMQAGDDPQLAGVIFGKDSFARLNLFGGDVRKWVQWLRTEIARLEEYNQHLTDEELSRVSPSSDDAMNPKWSLKVRLRSWSHSIRSKSLTSWNKKSQWVKLSAIHDRQELLVQFLVPKKILIRDLWTAGSGVSNSFVIALNVATRGFFWWYLPVKTATFFEEIRDLEKNVPLAIDSPSLSVSWGNQTLTEWDLEETLRVSAYLHRLPAERWEPYRKYLEALALVAKNDIHGRFEPTIQRMFFEAFRGIAFQCRDWDGASPFIDAAMKALQIFRDRIDSIDRELPRQIQLGEMLLQGTLIPNLSMRDAILMKLFCDLYISRLAHEALGYKFVKPNEGSRSAKA